MRIRNPNAPTEQLEHSSQRDWLITREPFIHPRSMMSVEPGTQFFQTFRSRDPKQNQFQPIEYNREHEDKEGQRQKGNEKRSRELAHWIIQINSSFSAYSRPLFSSIGRALLRSIKVAPPGEYRMPVGRPNPPTEELQSASQGGGPTARDLIFHPLGMACFITNAKFFQVFDSLCPKENPPHQLEDRL
jgi:hypothetical protein